MTDGRAETGTGPFDVAFVGNFSRDRIVAPGMDAAVPGGAVYHASIAAARAGAAAAAITKAARSDAHLLRPMSEAGVTVFHVASDETTSIENFYLDERLERRECRLTAFAGAYDEGMLAGIESRIWHAGGLARGEFDLALLKRLAARGELSADAQGFVRVARGTELVYEDWPEKFDALPLTAYFKADAAEAEVLTGKSDVREAARALRGWGAREVVITHPGGLLVRVGSETFESPFKPANMSGRTGRGDTCIAAYLARRLNHDPAESCRFAAALCSIKMERPGPFAGTVADVLERMSGL
ncbi:MAG: PfkB family carbohydrate kinase [bacterium]